MEKKYRWTWENRNGESHWKSMNPDCNDCRTCSDFYDCQNDRARYVAGLEKALGIGKGD